MPPKQPSHHLLIPGIVAAMFIWGLSWPSGKVLSHYCSPFNFSFYRFSLVAVSMVLLLIILRIRPTVSRAGWRPLAASGVLLGVYGFFLVTGLKNGTAGAGGVLVTTLNPIVSYALGILISRKAPGRNETIGLLLGILAGVVLLDLWKNADQLANGGNLYFLFAACSWAVMTKFTASGAKFGAPLAFSTWQYIITLLCLLPFTDYQEAANAMHIREFPFWFNLIFSSVIVTTGATTIFFYTSTRLGAERTSSFIFLVPFAAALSSLLFLGETIKMHTIVGGLIGIAAVYFINMRKKA